MRNIAGHLSIFFRQSTVIICLVIPNWLYSEESTNCTEWYLEYDWHWTSDQNANASHLINQITEINDTIFIVANSGVSYSLDGYNWENYTRHNPDVRVQKLIWFQERMFFLTYDQELTDRKGETSLKCTQAGNSWVFPGPEPGIIYSGNDTITLKNRTEKIYEAFPGTFISMSSAGKTRHSYFIAHGKESEISGLAGEPVFGCEVRGNMLYILTTTQLMSYRLEKDQLILVNIRKSENGAKLVKLGDEVYLKFINSIEVVDGCSSKTDLVRHLVNNVSAIYKFNNAILVQSETNGIGVLTNTGLNTYWIPNQHTRQVDGLLLSTDNRIYATNRYINFQNLTERDDPELSFRLVPPLIINIFGKNRIFYHASTLYKPGNIPERYRKYSETPPWDAIVQIKKLSDGGYLLSSASRVFQWDFSQDQLSKPVFDKVGSDKFNIMGLGELNGSGRFKYWVGTRDSLFLLDTGFNSVQTIPIRNVRSVMNYTGQLVIGSYGWGLNIWSPTTGLQPITLDRYSSNDYISEIGFQEGIFYLFSNKGIFYQDSALLVDNLKKGWPLPFFGALSKFSFETNGNFFNTSIRFPGYRLIATTQGVLKWKIPTVIVDTGQSTNEPKNELLSSLPLLESSSFSRQSLFWFDEDQNEWILARGFEARDIQEKDLLLIRIHQSGLVNQIYLPRKEKGIPVRVVLVIVGCVLLIGLIGWLIGQRKARLRKKAQSASLQSSWAPVTRTASPGENKILVQLIDHDLKGGLTVMNNLLDYMKEDLDPLKRRLIQNINRHSKDLVENVSQRFNEVVMEQEKSTVRPIDEVIHEVSVELEGYLQLKKQKLITDLRSGNPNVHNSEMLKRCVSILLSNAIKFAPPRSNVYISSILRKNRVSIEVIDEGPGLPDGWDFNEGNLSPKPGSYGEAGMGIALQTASKICLSYGGSLRLENEPGKGARGIIIWSVWKTKFDLRSN